MDDIGDPSRNWLTKPHPAVHYNTAVPEVEDLQVLEVVQVGLKVRDQLKGEDKNTCEEHYV